MVEERTLTMEWIFMGAKCIEDARALKNMGRQRRSSSGK
jgi:hypothetical protein